MNGHMPKVLTSLIVGGAIGYYIGFNAATASSLPHELKRQPSTSTPTTATTLPSSATQEIKPETEKAEPLDEEESSDEDEGAVTSEMGGVKAGMFEECKLVSAVGLYAALFCLLLFEEL